MSSCECGSGSDPDQSLMLLKPSAGVPHEGGHVLDVDSPQYKLLRDWIAQGVLSDVGQTTRVSALEVFPPVIDAVLASSLNWIVSSADRLV